MDETPIALQMMPDGRLLIRWSSGRELLYSPRLLREHCPCAHCNAARAKPQPAVLLPVLKPTELQPLSLTALEPLGNYAYSVHFSDGHNTGIYPLELLLRIGEPEA